jgi:leader peptidase (prepilin peptidase)/N-methyltransferase
VTAETLAHLHHPAFLAILGAVVGSFLNVVIHRLPRKISLVSPPSRCPHCERRVAPWENVPVVSWIFLRGKCRGCKKAISPRYPLVESLTALLFAACGAVVAPVALPLALSFVAAMVVVTFIDLDHMIIPDAITLPGVLIGLLAAVFGFGVSPLDAALGVIVGGGGLFAVASGYKAATGREGLGGGDVKLLAMVGAFLGPAGAFFTIMIGSLTGTIFACVYMLRTGHGRTAELPFGTFLAPGAVLVLFLGVRLTQIYWGLFS